MKPNMHNDLRMSLTSINPATSPSFELATFLKSTYYKFRTIAQLKGIELQLVDDMASRLVISGNELKIGVLLEKVFQDTIDLAGSTRINLSLRQLIRSENDVLLEFLLENNGVLPVGKKRITYYRSLLNARTMIEELNGKSEFSLAPGNNILRFMICCNWQSTVENTVHEDVTCLAAVQNRRVLIVEDNEINQQTIALMLQERNIQCEIACNGKEAIEIIEKNRNFDLILMDNLMPNMDGYEATYYIRKKLELAIPVLGMIPDDCHETSHRCFEMGMNQVIKKPFTAEQLLLQICSFMDSPLVALHKNKIA